MVLHYPFFWQLNPNLSLLKPVYIYIYIYIYILPSFSSSQPPLDSLKSASNVDFWGGVALLIPIGWLSHHPKFPRFFSPRSSTDRHTRNRPRYRQRWSPLRPTGDDEPMGMSCGENNGALNFTIFFWVLCLPCPNGWCQWHCFTHIDMCWSKIQKWCRVVIFFSDRDVNKHYIVNIPIKYPIKVSHLT